MSPLRLTGSTSGYSQIDAPAVAGDQTFTLPGTGGTLDRLNRAGNILQVVSANHSTNASSSSSTYSDTGLTATITPSSTSSKILVIASLSSVQKENATYVLLRLVRGSTTISTYELTGGFTNTSAINNMGGVTTNYLDSPATTSATTYKVQFASGSNIAIVRVGNNDSTSTITLLEVAA